MKQGNQPPSNYFKARDLNVNECSTYGDYYYNSGYNDYYHDHSYNDEYCEKSYYDYSGDYDNHRNSTSDGNAQTTEDNVKSSGQDF